MNKPNDFDTAVPYGDFKALPAGGYVCEIKMVEEGVTSAGKEQIKIYLDIIEGEFAGYFAERYKNDTRDNKKWGCIAYQRTLTDEGKTNGRFKAFITAAEDSNPGFKTVWGPAFAPGFKGKKVGVVFGREEYAKTDGSGTAWNTKPQMFRSIQAIREGDFRVPEDKALTQGFGDVYSRPAAPSNTPWMNIPDGVEDAGLPFN